MRLMRICHWCLFSHFRLWLYLLFIALLTLLFTWLLQKLNHRNSKEYSNLKRVKLSHSFISISDIPKEFQQYCNFHPPEGSEGLDSPEKLKSVVIVTRHGDRSPIIPITQLIGAEPVPTCELHEINDANQFIKLRSFLASARTLRRHFRLDKTFKDFTLIPSDSKCSAGRLTSFGAVQLGNLGGFLHQRYAVLLNSSKFDITTLSTTFQRTFQSAMAFAFGLISHGLRHKIKVVPAYSTHFCTQRWCSCMKITRLREMLEHEKATEFRQNAPDSVKAAVQTISRDILKNPMLYDPLALTDSLVGSFVCRRSKLPCDRGNCIRWKEASEIFEYAKSRSDKLKDGGIMREMSVVEALPVLWSVVNASKATTKSFLHYSGHDVTIRPLLRALNLYDGHVPVYAGRLVFEIFKESQFRLLYNGVDVTLKLSFCHSVSKFCSIASLESFLKNDIFNIADKSSIADICSLS